MTDYCWNLTVAVSTPSYHHKFQIGLARYFLPEKGGFHRIYPLKTCLVFKELNIITRFFLKKYLFFNFKYRPSKYFEILLLLEYKTLRFGVLKMLI